MTREEAIQYLEGMRIDRFKGYDSFGEFIKERNDALDMAISALQWQDKMIKDIENFILYGEEKTETKIAVEDFLNAPVINITESPNEVDETDDEVIDHDREWIIGCIKHDGFIKTDRFDKANQIILDALSAEPNEDLVQRSDVRHDIPQYCSWSKTYENMVQSITDGMREATEEERKSVNDYIESISHTVDSDLISRADAIEAVCKDCIERYAEEKECNAICTTRELLESLPSADAVRYETTATINEPISIQSNYVYVVRCKDCRYFKKIAERSDSGLCHRDIVASAWKENGYCSRGERKGGDPE